MKKIGIYLALLTLPLIAVSQKKTLDHNVYDDWKAAGERSISNNGKFVVYTVNPQEGDGILYVKGLENGFSQEIPRGYQARITEDSRFLIFKIRPFYKDSREARIKKKRPDDMPKDTLAIVELGNPGITRIPRVKSFRMPEEGGAQWLAYHLDKALPEARAPRQKPDSLTQIDNLSRMADSLMRVADSLRNKANEARQKGLTVLQAQKKENRPARTTMDPVTEGTTLVLRNLHTGEEFRFDLVNDYQFSKTGTVLLLETTRRNNDSVTQAALLWVHTDTRKADTVMKRFNDAKNYAFDEDARQLAFVAERDSSTKALQKFYKLYYYKAGADSALLRADRNTAGVKSGMTISPDYNNQFSKDGSRLFFGLSPIRQPKDTTLVDFETARLDIWHYNDDYLQPQQLLQVQQELRRSYLAVAYPGDRSVLPLADENAENIQLVNEGNAPFFLAISTKGNRKQAQWTGRALQSAWLVNVKDGSRKLIKSNQEGFFSASPNGKYVSWYDGKAKHYFAYNLATGVISNITRLIKTPLWDEEDDHPDTPPAHGTAGWTENDESLLVYDKYDIWAVDPTGAKAPVNLTQGMGRAAKTELRYQRTDREERFIKPGQEMLLRAFNTVSKYAGYYSLRYQPGSKPQLLAMLPNSFAAVSKAENANRYLLQKSNIKEAELFWSDDLVKFEQLTNIAEQQEQYNWLSAELVKWKMFDGKESEGLLFKPENFDPKKKYPVIFYFYERNADGLYNYRTPAPSASTINIPYFVSNGYLVFDPNIYYKNGDPGESAYNSVVSAAKHLAKLPYVDSTKMAIQGQSWGGYQVAYLVTRTKMFAAAGAGAPVANMTSAYGGIRWGSGMNRQFQYEHTQSRIGATLWQRRDLYIKNSPLFTADKVTTPLLIMHNDKDGAVPWYQGIEYFTALRRLNKKVWLLQYNDEDHNLVQRRNRKDLSLRLSQFFDHYLKGAPAPRWLSEGVPAVSKGIDWGFEIDGEKKSF